MFWHVQSDIQKSQPKLTNFVACDLKTFELLVTESYLHNQVHHLYQIRWRHFNRFRFIMQN